MTGSLDEFRKVKVAYDKRSASESGLVCMTSVYCGCPQITLRRESWMSGEAGIFFSIWTDSDDLSSGPLRYNIHALKVRRLKSYVITSRDFAAAFRRDFKSISKSWPNVRVDYGPLNLMEGWMELREKTFARDVLALMNQFERVHPIIDRLLEERIAPVRRRALDNRPK